MALMKNTKNGQKKRQDNFLYGYVFEINRIYDNVAEISNEIKLAKNLKNALENDQQIPSELHAKNPRKLY
jgi:hypothetical protein